MLNSILLRFYLLAQARLNNRSCTDHNMSSGVFPPCSKLGCIGLIFARSSPCAFFGERPLPISCTFLSVIGRLQTRLNAAAYSISSEKSERNRSAFFRIFSFSWDE